MAPRFSAAWLDPGSEETTHLAVVDAAGNESPRSNAVTVVVGGGAPK